MNEEMNNLPKNDLQDIDIELLKKFIGKNSEKILNKKFSIPGFFFGPFYAAYRKMFVFALLYVFVTSIISVALSQTSSIIGFVVSIIINVIYGFFAYKLYIKHAIKKINKLKNNNSLNESIDSACIRKGGTSIGLIFALLFIDILFVIVITAIIGTLLLGMAFNSFAKDMGNLSDTIDETSIVEENLDESITDNETDDLDESDESNETSDSDVNLSELIKIDFPECFRETIWNEEDRISYEWNVELGVDFDCTFDLIIMDGESDAEQLIQEKAEVNNVSNYVGTKRSNGIIWHYFKTEDESSEITYYHATEKDGKVYWAEYKIEKNVIGEEDREKAMEYYNDIFSSIQWVE